MNKFWLFVFLSIFCSVSHAGSWSSSGGGDIIKDAYNPWFLNNVKDVTYCVRIDEKNFGVSENVANKQIQAAFAFWRRELAAVVFKTFPKFGPLVLGTQNFRRVECSPHVDIAFQFGVLGPKQRAFLKDPKSHGAITIRTDYDQTTMRGRGFVYFAAAKGPLTYDHKTSVPDIWSTDNSAVLYLALLHELGHMFGLQHMGTLGELMSEGFIELQLGNRIASSNQEVGSRFVTLPTDRKVFCAEGPLLDRWKQFFMLAAKEKCLKVIFQHDDGPSQLVGPSRLTVLAGESRSNLREVAKAELKMERMFPVRYDPIWLPDGQKVFAKDELPNLGIPAIPGPTLFSVEKAGKLTSSDGKLERQIKARFEQGKAVFSIDGVGPNGEIFSVF